MLYTSKKYYEILKSDIYRTLTDKFILSDTTFLFRREINKKVPISEFDDLLSSTYACIAGSSILKCVLNETWSTDIDIFACKKYKEEYISYFTLKGFIISENNNSCIYSCLEIKDNTDLKIFDIIFISGSNPFDEPEGNFHEILLKGISNCNHNKCKTDIDYVMEVIHNFDFSFCKLYYSEKQCHSLVPMKDIMLKRGNNCKSMTLKRDRLCKYYNRGFYLLNYGGYRQLVPEEDEYNSYCKGISNPLPLILPSRSLYIYKEGIFYETFQDMNTQFSEKSIYKAVDENGYLLHLTFCKQVNRNTGEMMNLLSFEAYEKLYSKHIDDIYEECLENNNRYGSEAIISDYAFLNMCNYKPLCRYPDLFKYNNVKYLNK